jgi:hypothetical protein
MLVVAVVKTRSQKHLQVFLVDVQVQDVQLKLPLQNLLQVDVPLKQKNLAVVLVVKTIHENINLKALSKGLFLCL